MLTTSTKDPIGTCHYPAFLSYLRFCVSQLSDRDIGEMEAVEEFIANNFESITSLSDLARRAGVNKFKLKHTFKLLYGITAFGYVKGLKMDQAKTLLIETTMSVKEIGRITGYRSLPNFTAGFKKRFGMSPSAFKRSLNPTLQGST